MGLSIYFLRKSETVNENGRTILREEYVYGGGSTLYDTLDKCGMIYYPVDNPTEGSSLYLDSLLGDYEGCKEELSEEEFKELENFVKLIKSEIPDIEDYIYLPIKII